MALEPGTRLDEQLRRSVTTVLRTSLSPRHIPDQITAVPVIPRNLTGKKLELPVKRILQGSLLTGGQPRRACRTHLAGPIH